MYILKTISLIIVVCIIFWAKDKKDDANYRAICENRYYNSVFPQYETFFKSALVSFADKLKICKGLGSTVESYLISKSGMEIFPTYATMSFTVISEGIKITDEFRKKYIENVSRAAELNILNAYNKTYGGADDVKGFVKTKIRTISPTEIKITFAIQRNCIYNFEDII